MFIDREHRRTNGTYCTIGRYQNPPQFRIDPYTRRIITSLHCRFHLMRHRAFNKITPSSDHGFVTTLEMDRRNWPVSTKCDGSPSDLAGQLPHPEAAKAFTTTDSHAIPRSAKT